MAFSLKETVVILGTSRSNGNIRATVREVLDCKRIEIVDLAEIDIGTYDYQHHNKFDGFLPLVEKIARKPFWILATPVYW